jgi:hypothetical protein
VASGDRDTFQLASESTTIIFPVHAGEMARIGPAEVRERYGVNPSRCRISSPFVATRLTNCRELGVLVLKERQTCFANTERSKISSRRGVWWSSRRCFGSIDRSQPWMHRRLCPPYLVRHRRGRRRRSWSAIGGLTNWLIG